MRCLRIGAYRGKLNLDHRNSIPKISKNQLLIRVHYSSINPSDLGFMAGVYGTPEYIASRVFPLTIGFEGSGIIEDSEDKSDIGKAAFFYSEEGAWADFTRVRKENCIMLPSTDQDLIKEASCFFINPLTAIGFIQVVKNSQSTSTINTSANSALGKIFRRLCEIENIALINIVRGEIKHNGTERFLTTDDPQYKSKLKSLAYDLDCRIAFDSVGGTLTGNLLNCLPSNSTIYHYGNLSLRSIGNVLTEDILFMNKTIRGFYLLNYMNSSGGEIKKEFNRIINKYGYKAFSSPIVNEFTPENVEFAIQEYRKTWSKGKTLLKFI